uniref:Uncharacterized protein n=1 Tax=Anguilla anguilla TaxID=7936 RepID=A0A0E9SS57_ANGAN
MYFCQFIDHLLEGVLKALIFVFNNTLLIL